jgi:hypothetical protein
LQREAVHLRHHDVRNDEVGDGILNLIQGLLAICGRVDLVVLAEAVLQKLPNCAVILDN